MLRGFSEIDEERTVEAFEEVEAEYEVEELNRAEGLAVRLSDREFAELDR